MQTKLVPKTTNTETKICKLKRDNVNTENSWLLLSDGKTLSIGNKNPVEGKIVFITLTYKEFERFIKFYETGE